MTELREAVIDEGGGLKRVIDGEELPVAEAIANKIAILKEVEKLRFLVDYFSIR